MALTPHLLTDAEISYIQSLYPLLFIETPSAQIKQALLYYFSGFSRIAAAKEAGFATYEPFSKYLASPEGQAIVTYIRDTHFKDIRVDRELITTMLLNAHSRSANTTEEVMAIRELAKLHDLYPNEKRSSNVNVTVNQGNVTNLKQLTRMSDEDLLQIASPKLKKLLNLPEPVAVIQRSERKPEYPEDYDAELDV